MDKKTVKVTVEFTYDITRKGIEDGQHGESVTTFSEALDSDRYSVKNRELPVFDLVEDYDDVKYTLEWA